MSGPTRDTRDMGAVLWAVVSGWPLLGPILVSVFRVAPTLHNTLLHSQYIGTIGTPCLDNDNEWHYNEFKNDNYYIVPIYLSNLTWTTFTVQLEQKDLLYFV